VFVIQMSEQVIAHGQQLTETLRKQFPRALPVMEAPRDDGLAFLHFPPEHWRKIWSTKPLERLNVAPRGALCEAEPQTPHQCGRHLPQLRRLFWEAAMAKIAEPEEPPELTVADFADPVPPVPAAIC